MLRAYDKIYAKAYAEETALMQADVIAYLGGGFGEGKGTTFLEINRVGEVLDNFDHYTLPNMEDTEA